MPQLQYLTLQDVLWINTLVTGMPQPFRFLELEEATFYQYGYGASTELISQAGRFLAGFWRLKPFEAGNQATGFLACLAYLRLNGAAITLRDAEAADWVKQVAAEGEHDAEAFRRVVAENEAAPIEGNNLVEIAVQAILEAYPRTVKRLLGGY